MIDYIPYPFFSDDVPIDISFVFEDEKPAGKHGFLKVDGRKFVFEDGTAVKFWGTNLNGTACFPEKPYAEKLARRLAKIGINLIRFHQLDAEWHAENLFSSAKGKRVTDAHLCPKSMDKLDYFIYCLKNEGIYVYLDMLTYRRFHTDEGIENAHLLQDSAKPYSIFSRRLIELQKEFCREIWTHENPYTALKYCDDPSIVLTEITNECDLFLPNRPYTAIEPYHSEFVDGFAEWLTRHGIERDARDFDMASRTDTELVDFKIELQEKYYNEMIECMRECGVKIPIAGTNWTRSPANVKTNLVCDFLDAHPYYYDWKWGEFEHHCMNRGITDQRETYLTPAAGMTNVNKPTYISEWDMPWPNEKRAESPIFTAAIGAFQGWSGFAIHTYSYLKDTSRIGIIGEEMTGTKVGNVPYRKGVFATWNDPAKFGLFYHAALITRRGDVKEGGDTYALRVSEHDEWWDSPLMGYNIEKHKYTVSFNTDDGIKALSAVDDEGCITSDTGELFRSWEKRYGTVKTDMTKCAYGELLKNGEIDLDGIKVKCDTDYAVIALSSLTDKKITESDNILLTTVGRAQNTDAKFAGELMLDVGKPPIIVENIKAKIELETKYSDLKVWAVSAEGFYIGTVPTEYRDGKLIFTLGEISRSMYYLIVKD